MLIVFKGEVTVRLISINGSVTISGKIAVKEFKSYPSGDAFKISIECGGKMLHSCIFKGVVSHNLFSFSLYPAPILQSNQDVIAYHAFSYVLTNYQLSC